MSGRIVRARALAWARRGLTATVTAVLGLALVALTPTNGVAANSGWCDGYGDCYSNALTAGYYEYYKTVFGGGTFNGVTPTGTPGVMNANWYYFSQQSGPITYYCPTTNAPGAPGTCPGGPPPCVCNNGGTPVAATTHPIDILSGNKRLTSTDFANASGTLVLTRVFASAAQSSAASSRANTAAAPLAPALGLGNWLFDFQYELHITGTAASSPVILLTPGGAAPAFQQASGSSLTLVNYLGSLPPNPQTAYALSIVGSWPTNLTAQSTTWTLTDGSDTVYELTTQLDPNTGAYDIARPTNIQWRDGHSWTLVYNTTAPQLVVTDNFNNTASFTWQSNPSNGAPLAITSVTLPGNSTPHPFSIQYTYSSICTSCGIPWPDVLSQVQWKDNNGVVQDSTTYGYANANCPYNVTGVTDAGGTPRWGVTYDNTSCMATVSSVNGAPPGPTGGVRAYAVAYPSQPGLPGSTFTRQVTNPLGTVSIYNYVYNSTSGGLQLTEVDENVGSSPVTGLCPNTTPPAGESFRCYYYNSSNGFVSELIDENGNEETFPTYDPRGMPTQIIEAASSMTPRTTNIVWESNLHEPYTVAIPGLVKTTYAYNSVGQVTQKTVADQTGHASPLANGVTPTTSETAAAARIQAAYPNDQLFLIPK